MADTFHKWSDVGGVLQNHFISDELLKVAFADMMVVPFTSKIPSYGKKAGETVNIKHVKKLTVPTDATLEATSRVPLDVMSWGDRAITVVEMGRGVIVDELESILSKFDPEAEAYRELKDQMSAVLDNAAAAAFKSTDVKLTYSPTSLTGGTWGTNGTAGALATSNITKHHIRAIRNAMASTYVIPPFKGKYWMALLSTAALDGLADDYEHWSLYLRDEDYFYRYEVGQMYNIRLQEVVRTEAFAATSGSSTVLGEGVVFGDRAVARAVAKTPELIVTRNYGQDANRRHAIHWLGVMKFASWWNTATKGEAKIVRLCST